MENIDYLKLFEQLKELLPRLRRGEIARIIYGDEEMPRAHSYFQISIIPTNGGLNFAIHQISMSGCTGSGEYIGYPIDNDEVIKKAQERIQCVHRPVLDQMARRMLESARRDPGYRKPNLQFYGMK